jgi:hypothetical protein
VLANASIGWRIFDVAARQSVCAWVLRRPLHMKKGEEMSRLKKLRTFALGGLIVMTWLTRIVPRALRLAFIPLARIKIRRLGIDNSVIVPWRGNREESPQPHFILFMCRWPS